MQSNKTDRRVRFRSLSIGLIVLLTGAAAYLGGSFAGSIINDKKEAEVHAEEVAERKLFAERLLERMGTLSVGDTLPDFEFDDTNENHFMLSDLITGNTIICYVEPACTACHGQLKMLDSLIRKGEMTKDEIIVIGTGDFEETKFIHNDIKLSFRILNDHQREIGTKYNISSYPFNIYVNSSREIGAIHPYALTKEEIVTLR
ncbi:MAG: redoxin domain-containing protein [candidate division Zixibacteria bacterium]|nr:redoxin domain-containing protein [candidate division Zixibacteria bacterium]